jgi:hypothetical protein
MKLSQEMFKLLQDIKISSGYTFRTAGGYWWAGKDHKTHYSTCSVKALVKRGILIYTEWKQGKNYNFPIRADIAPAEKAEPVQNTLTTGSASTVRDGDGPHGTDLDPYSEAYDYVKRNKQP